jgi:DNA-binding transcriptional ArsR family regulator
MSHDPEAWDEEGWGRVPRTELLPEKGGRLHKVNQTAQAVYLVLCGHVDYRSGIAYPSKGRIAKALGLKARAVGTALKVLTDAGLIELKRLGGGVDANGKGLPSVYRITPPNGAPTDTGAPSYTGAPTDTGARGSRERCTKTSVTAHARAQEQNKNRSKNKTHDAAPISSAPPALADASERQFADDPLRDAIALVYSQQYRETGEAHYRQVANIDAAYDALVELGADPADVRARWEWMKRNDGRLSLKGLIQHWQYAGECIASGYEPGKREGNPHRGGSW